MITKTFPFNDDPINLFQFLKGRRHLFFLDSALRRSSQGRYSFLGFDPFRVVLYKGCNYLPALQKEFRQYSAITQKDSNGNNPTPFPYGLMGFFGYDLGLYLEKIPVNSTDDLLLPDGLFAFYDTVLTIDHVLKKLMISSSGLPEMTNSLRQKKAHERLNEMSRLLTDYQNEHRREAANKIKPLSDNNRLIFKSNFACQTYVRAVQKALEHIHRGDIYQVNLAQRFECPIALNLEKTMMLYKNLRALSPTCFGAYFDAGKFQILSSSPERYLTLSDNLLQTFPMKGTRPRGQTRRADMKNRRALQESAKEKAELLMVTDLERNDLGRVCRYGSVRVKTMRQLETYSTVFQATACVEGILKTNHDVFDVMSACFPGGSITGCPKIRAMEIIETLEPHRRGIYTGALGYISFTGRMDFNMLIRTILNCHNKLYFHVGGGIVADSIPQAEYEETLVKAAALRRAIETI